MGPPPSGSASEIPPVDAVERGELLERYEARFRRAGLPLFDEDFTAATDVFNRAAPLLVLVVLVEVLGAIQLDWSLLANLAAVLAGLAILLVAVGLVNRARGRPFRSFPEDVEAPELAAFVVVPALLPLVFGAQVTSSLVTAAVNLLLLLVIYAVIAYGLLSILYWVGGRLADQLRSSFMLLARAVPLLLIIVLLAFVNTEMWQVFSSVSREGLSAIGLLFLLLGVSFLLARLPREVRQLEGDVGSDAPPLSTRQRRNVGLVLFVSQAVQVLAVSLLIALFFIVFGAIAITEPVRLEWIGTEGNVLVSFTAFGESVQVTSELLRVAAGLASFSGLYFAIAMLTDATYREEFLDELTDDLRSVFRERAEYLRVRSVGAEESVA